MRQYLSAGRLLVIISAIAAATVGCGGGSSSPSGPTQAPVAIDNIIRNPGTATVSNLTPLAQTYQNQLNSSPGSVSANAGFAISNAALQGATLEGFTNPFTGGALIGAVAQSQPSAYARIGPALMIWNAPGLISAGKSPSLSPLDLLPDPAAAMTGYQTGSIATDQTQLRTVDAQLALVQQSLDIVISDPGFVYVIADPTQPTNANATVELGQAEFEVLQTAVSVARAVLNASVAYDLDPGSYNFNLPISTVLATQYADASPSIAPTTEYIPGSPFGTLASDGSARVKAVQTQLLGAASAAEVAITDVEARNSNGFLLNPGTVVTSTQLTQYKTDIETDSTILTTQQTVSGFSGGSMVVDLPEFFDSPPPDLKVFMPSLTVVPTGAASGDMVTLRVTSANYPDLTFGGLLPGNNLARIWHYTSSQGDQTTEAQVIAFELATTR